MTAFKKGYKADSAIAIGIALLFFAAYFILPDQFMGLFLNSDSSQALSTRELVSSYCLHFTLWYV